MRGWATINDNLQRDTALSSPSLSICYFLVQQVVDLAYFFIALTTSSIALSLAEILSES